MTRRSLELSEFKIVGYKLDHENKKIVFTIEARVNNDIIKVIYIGQFSGYDAAILLGLHEKYMKEHEEIISKYYDTIYEDEKLQNLNYKYIEILENTLKTNIRVVEKNLEEMFKNALKLIEWLKDRKISEINICMADALPDNLWYIFPPLWPVMGIGYEALRGNTYFVTTILGTLYIDKEVGLCKNTYHGENDPDKKVEGLLDIAKEYYRKFFVKN